MNINNIIVFFFILIGNKHAQGFIIQPVSVVQAAGLEAVFECLYLGATAYIWALNGSFLSDYPPGVDTDSPSVDSPARLIMPATPQYNNTVVQCEPVVREGVLMSMLSENATLRVQGPLYPVTNLHVLYEQSSIIISWEASFSLNLTTAEPDIQYCVDVYNVTGGGDNHLQSVCNITDTHYTFTASDPDQLFNFTVTPRSNVEGSQNGTTSQPVQGYILGDPLAIGTSDIEKIVGPHYIQLIIQKALLGPPGRTPTHYMIEVTCDQTPFHNFSVIPNKTSDTAILSISGDIPRHQICSLVLVAFNKAGSTQYTHGLKISTHDVQKAAARFSQTKKQLDISCSYFDRSSDSGFMAIAFSPQNPLPAYHAARRNGLEDTTNASMSGQFDQSLVVVYDLQQNTGLPEKSPALRVSSNITNGPLHNSEEIGNGEKSESSLVNSLVVTFFDEEICINCSFSAGELTGYVGVIHSAQSEDLTLTVLTVERSGEMNCTNSTEGNYSIAVFGWFGTKLEQEPTFVGYISSGKSLFHSTPPEESTPSGETSIILATVLSAVGVMVVVVVVVVAVLVALVVKSKKKRSVTVHSKEREGPPPPDPEHNNIALKTMTREDITTEECISDQAQHQESNGSARVSESNLSTTEDTNSDQNKQPSIDPTRTQYSIDLSLVSGESQDSAEEALPASPLFSSPHTPETVLSELHPFAEKQKELGEALGVPEHMRESGEMEVADEIVRTKGLEGEYKEASPRERFLDPVAESGGTSDELTGEIRKVPIESSQDETESRGKFTGYYGHGLNIFKSYVPEKETQYHKQCRPQVEVAVQHSHEQETRHLQNSCVEADEDSPAHEWSSSSYYSSLAHSLNLYQSFDAPERHKARAIRTLTCGTNNLIHPDNIVQQWMQGLESQNPMANNDCHEREEFFTVDKEQFASRKNISYNNLSTMADLMNKNNRYRGGTKYSVSGKSNQVFFKMIITKTPVISGSDANSSTKQPSDDHKPPSQEVDSKASMSGNTPLGLAAKKPSIRTARYGGKRSGFLHKTVVVPPQEKTVSGQYVVDKNTRQKTKKINYPQNCMFSWLIETSHPPEHHLKGILGLKHGYIFQPAENEFFGGFADWQGNGWTLSSDLSWLKREEVRFYFGNLCPSELGWPSPDRVKKYKQPAAGLSMMKLWPRPSNKLRICQTLICG